MSFAGARAPSRDRSVHWSRDDGWLAIAGPALIFLGHLLYGAMLPRTALSFAFIWAAMVAVCLLRPRLRNDFLRLDGLAAPAMLFAAVIAVALWSLSPIVPGGPHPVWGYLKISPGAATIDKSGTILETFKLLGLACVFLVGAINGGSDARARLAVNTVLALGAAYSIWAFLTFITTRTAGWNRLEASFMSANTAGTLAAALLVLSVGPLSSALRCPGRNQLFIAAATAAATLLSLICLFMTASRGAFLAAMAGLLVFGLLLVVSGRVRLSRAVLTGGALSAAIVALLAVAGDFLINRLIGGGDHNLASRAVIAGIHWDAFLTSPLTGFGLGTFDAINRTLLDTSNFMAVWPVRAAHNIYLSWLEQAGLLGALPMFACIGLLILTTLRKALRRTRAINLIFALLAVDVVFLAHGVTDFALEMFSVAGMWAYVLGLQFGLAQGSSTR